MKRTQIYIPDGQTYDLKKEAKSEGVSKSEIIRRAISYYFRKLYRNKKK